MLCWATKSVVLRLRRSGETMPLPNFIPQRPNQTLFCFLSRLETKEKPRGRLGRDGRELKVGRKNNERKKTSLLASLSFITLLCIYCICVMGISVNRSWLLPLPGPLHPATSYAITLAMGGTLELDGRAAMSTFLTPPLKLPVSLDALFLTHFCIVRFQKSAAQSGS